MLLTYFVDSLSNPLFIVTICVPKRRIEMIYVDYQMIMRCVSKIDGVENEESMWKHSPKNWGKKTLLSSVRQFSIVASNNFRNFYTCACCDFCNDRQLRMKPELFLSFQTVWNLGVIFLYFSINNNEKALFLQCVCPNIKFFKVFQLKILQIR